MRYVGLDLEDAAERWARERLQLDAPPRLFRAFSAVDSEDFVCVVVLTGFSSRNIDMNIVIRDKVSVRPKETVKMFNGIFSYTFDHCRAKRVTGLLRGKNTESQRICRHFGFKPEGVVRQAFEDDDLHIYGFLADEFRSHAWYRGQQ